jgi:hypothetical protein
MKINQIFGTSPSFEDLRKYLSNIPYINNGGCGIAALAMYFFLKDKGEAVELVFFHKIFDAERALSNIKINIESGVTASSANHCGIFYNGQFLDCDSILNPSNYLCIIFTTDVIMREAVAKSQWNSDFDRDYYLPQIEKYIGFSLEIN